MLRRSKSRPKKGMKEKKRRQCKRNALKNRRKRIQCMKKTMCRIDTWHGGETLGGSVWTTDHTCGRREAVDERGEQPRGQRGKRARPNMSQEKKGRNGSKGQRGEKKATHCTSSSTSQPQAPQPQPQQQQLQQRPQQCAFSDTVSCR